MPSRRDLLRAGGAGAALGLMPSSISRALALPARSVTGTIRDVEHVVILMQENRSFDHYFGTLRGVRGFRDSRPIPLASGKPVWFQSDGEREIPPYHHDTRTTSAMRAPGTPHSFADAHAAWGQGRMDHWPKFKTPYAMGHYRRADLPFQFALAEAFTICDAYHCSVATGTDPNRIMFWSGANFDPRLRAQGINATEADSEPDNLRCWVKGALPEPGYTYAGSAFTWDTIPDVLERAGISWRIYQDPNDNWTGAMHGGLAFASFRDAKPGSVMYEKGMRLFGLDKLAQDVKAGTLPQVSWVLPPALYSEHPGPSSPIQGAEFTGKVLDAITANPDVWGRTVFFLTFDENDGYFDHVPPPAPPSFNRDGTLAGKSTVDLAGLYFSDPEGKRRKPDDTITGTVRPWGLGPRVPMYVISPWSKGGFVCSQVFDHTSVGRFLETRFGVTVPAISPWHRAVSGDLTSAFDFARPNDPVMPPLPHITNSDAQVAGLAARPKPAPPATPDALFQEAGVRPSRPLPYVLEVTDTMRDDGVALTFHNRGRAGAVFHVYDLRRLDRIPRRFTVESGKSLADDWNGGGYNLWVLGPNGFLRSFAGNAAVPLTCVLSANPGWASLRLVLHNGGTQPHSVTIRCHPHMRLPDKSLLVPPGVPQNMEMSVAPSGHWYDMTLEAEDGFRRQFAGRIETGEPSTSDPFTPA